jgi:predicted nucleic acid-binding protein
MEPLFVDSNIFIRYLTQDDPAKAETARALLKQAEAGQLTIVTSESIVVEAVQVLSSKVLYNQPRSKVTSDLTTILSLPKLKLPNKRVCLRALALWASASASVDFVDALTVAHMEHQGISTIASFDQDFDRFSQIQRRPPTGVDAPQH